MNIYKVLPDLGNERQMKLWHKALRAQWSSVDMPWHLPRRIRSRRLRESVSRVLTPILMGEQSALYSVTSQIHELGHRSEVPAQFYLTTWAVDEARHTEVFARYYGRLENEPMSIRRLPEAYLFQAQITAKDTADWLAGVLVSEVMATLLMQEFVRIDIDEVLSTIADGILDDEARHLGFNHLYMEHRFTEVFGEGRARGEERKIDLEQRLRHVLSFVPPVLRRLEPDLEEMGLDWPALFEELEKEAVGRLRQSADRAKRVAAGERERPRGATLIEEW